MAKAGVVGRVQLRRNLLAFSKGAISQTKTNAQETALVAALLAKNVGQNTIATTPSSLSAEPKIGRIWTGAMFEDFDADVRYIGTKITINFGWIKRKQKYYLIQEDGGFAFGKTVTPMHALANALVASQDYLNSKGIK